MQRAVLREAPRDRDLLVVQKRAPQRRQWRVRLLLRVLGLSGPDSAHLHASGSVVVRRMLGTTSTFVQVITLAFPAEPAFADTFVAPGVEDMSPEHYEIDGGEGLQFDLPEAERLNMESSEGSYSLAWTTALPLTTLVPRLQAFLPEKGDAELTVVDGDGARESIGPSRTVIESVLADEAALAFWRLETDDLTLTWEAPEETDSLGQPGLLGLITDEFVENDLQRLLTETATPHIGS